MRGDGVDASTWSHVEGGYLRALEHLESILATRPFLLGARPSLADFGYFGPMFRHFGCDPTPVAIMRDRAPGVYAWVARVWNARASDLPGGLDADIPADWGPILDEIGAVPWAEKARAELSRIGGRAPAPGSLTPSEERVAALVAEGKTNREVAAALFVSERTVEGHLTRIYPKLGVRSRTELARRLAAEPTQRA